MLMVNTDTRELVQCFHKPGKEECSVVVPAVHYRECLYADERKAGTLPQRLTVNNSSPDGHHTRPRTYGDKQGIAS